MPNIVMAKITKKSRYRIDSNTYFKETRKLNKKIDDLINTPKSAKLLTIDTVMKSQSEINQMWKEINAFDTKNNNLLIHNSNLNTYLLSMNPSEKATNEFQLESLKKNHYLKEAIAILDDLNAAKK
jgi:carboxyl-terminal processing protease